MYEAAAFSSCMSDSPSACTPHYGTQTSEREREARERVRARETERERQKQRSRMKSHTFYSVGKRINRKENPDIQQGAMFACAVCVPCRSSRTHSFVCEALKTRCCNCCRCATRMAKAHYLKQLIAATQDAYKS